MRLPHVQMVEQLVPPTKTTSMLLGDVATGKVYAVLVLCSVAWCCARNTAALAEGASQCATVPCSMHNTYLYMHALETHQGGRNRAV